MRPGILFTLGMLRATQPLRDILATGDAHPDFLAMCDMLDAPFRDPAPGLRGNAGRSAF